MSKIILPFALFSALCQHSSLIRSLKMLPAPNGFYEPSKVRDFPLRDKKVTLIVRRRRWVDETTGKSIGNTYDLVAEGTRHSVEFAAFLKESFGQIPDISLFA